MRQRGAGIATAVLRSATSKAPVRASNSAAQAWRVRRSLSAAPMTKSAGWRTTVQAASAASAAAGACARTSAANAARAVRMRASRGRLGGALDDRADVGGGLDVPQPLAQLGCAD